MYGALTDYELEKYVFNADFLYLPALFRDVILGNGELKNWYLTPTPYFFPDFGIYAIASLISKDFRITLIIANAIAYGILIFLIGINLKTALNRDFNLSEVLILIGIFSLPILGTISGKYHLIYHLFSITNHLGNAINSLIAFWLFQKYTYTSKPLFLILLACFFPIFYLSDILALLSIVFSLIGYVVFSRAKFKLSYTTALLILPLIAALILENNLKTFLYKIKPQKLNFENWSISLQNFSDYLIFIFSELGWVMFFVLASLMISIFQLIKSPKVKNQILWFPIFSLIFCLSATVLNGLLLNNASARYFFVWLFIAFSFSIFFMLSSAPQIKNRYSIIMILSLFSSFLLLYKPPLNVRLFVPEKIERISSILKDNNLSNGVSDYWLSNPINVFEHEVFTIPLYKTHFKPYFHITNSDYAFKKTFNFIIEDAENPFEAIPQDLILDTLSFNSEFNIYRTHPFGFDKHQNYELR